MIERAQALPTAINGFTLVELLVASLIAMVIAASVLAVATEAQRTFQAQPEQADLQQRIRFAVDSLQQELIMAGAGTYAGPARGPLNNVMASVMPYRAFGDVTDPSRNIFYRRDTISVLYVPSTPSQSTLSVALLAGAADVQLAALPNCPLTAVVQICGLAAGARVMIVDDKSQWDVFTVDQIGMGTATLRRRGPVSPATYEAGATISEVRLATYYLKADAATGVSQLFRHDGWTTDLPVVDDVVALSFDYFGDPEPPRLTGAPFDEPGPWTTYGPRPPGIGEVWGMWPPGENCTFRAIEGEQVPRLATLASDDGGPVALAAGLLTDGPWCPDETSPNRFDADLLRVRTVRVTLRAQAAAASLRGPAGALFVKRGTARAGGLFVPDLEVQFDVTPRNLNVGR